MGTGQIPALPVLWWSGHEGSSNGICGACNVLLSRGLACAVMPSICGALNRPLRQAHPEGTTALAANADLLTAGVVADEYARALLESVASKVYETSLWAAAKQVAEVIRPALVQVADHVPPKSVARDMAYAKLQSRIVSAAEAVQAAKLHHELLPEKHDSLLGAWRLGTGTSWTAMHKSRQRYYKTRNGGWLRRCDSAGRLMQDRVPHVPCAKATTETCASSRWRSTRFTLFAASVGRQSQTAPSSLVRAAQAHRASWELRGHGAPCP